jgi:hypothetical protein
MLIHTTDLQKYTICPMMCKFGTPLPKNPFLFALKQALIYLYAFEMSNETKVNQQSMMSKWDRIWLKEAKTAKLKNKEISKKAVDGWMIIKKYMNRVYLKDESIPHIVGLNYRGQLGSCYIDTNYDVILSDENGFLTLIEFSMSTDERHLQWQLDSDIAAKTKLLILHQSLGGATKCQLIRYNLNKHLNKASIYATNEFLKDTEQLVYGIINNIKNNLYYPSPTCKCVHPEKCKNGKR